jgi:drug/metabolite transporter, DME family
MQRATLGIWRYQRAAGLYAVDPGRLSTRSVTVGAALIVGSALAFALDGPMAQAAYRQGLDPAAFGFWRALAGAVVLGGFLATRPRSGVLAGVRRMRRAAAIRLALAALTGLGLNLALFQAFARLPVAVAVAAFGCYPLLVAAWEAASRQRSAGAVRLGLATVAVIGLVLLIRPDPSVSVPAAGLLLALLAAVLHAAYIVLSRDGWGEIGDGAATFLIVATAAAGLGVLAAVTRPTTVLAPGTDLRLTTLLLLEGALAGAAAPLLFLAGLRRIGATQTAVLSLCEPLAATLLAAVLLSQLPAPSQLLGAALLVGAGVAVQLVPRPAPSPGRIGASLGSIAEAATAEMKVNPLAQDKQWFVNTLRRLGYTEAAEEAERELPDSVSTDELIKFSDRFNISRDEVMSQMGGSP